jgi:hypothetical protein
MYSWANALFALLLVGEWGAIIMYLRAAKQLKADANGRVDQQVVALVVAQDAVLHAGSHLIVRWVSVEHLAQR